MRCLKTAVFLLLCVCFVATEQKPLIKGKVTDSEGAAITNARVLIHWDSSGSSVGHSDNIGIQQDLIVTTDATGHYVASVPAGFYDVFISAMAFTPIASKVRVKQGKGSTHDVKLRLDPLVSQELAQ